VVLLIDNYDSFVHTLAGYLRALGAEAVVRRHDAITVDEIARLAPSHLVVSPGPCGPAEAGISVAAIRRLGATTPVLGVCLGHQCIAAAFGGRVVRAGRPMHGKTSPIAHDATGLFAGLPSPFHATRYHSLAVAREGLPAELRVTATAADDGEIMALAHATLPVHGVQFHPESILTEHGRALLARFLAL
jgi:anthranilate synthase component 2